MYRENELSTCLYGLAGWRQNQNPEYPTLPASLTASLTSLYYQDAHPLICIENLDQALKNYDVWTYPSYAEHEVYAIGDKVRYSDGKVYEALAAIADAPLVLESADWVEVELLAQKLEALTRAAINKVANAMVTQKKLDGVSKSIFENIQLFSGVGDITQKVVKQSRFVGFELRMKSARDVALAVRRIGTQFSAANPDFKLWLFHSSQSEPVTSVDMALSRANAFQWTDSDLILQSLSSQLFPSGSYYLGYYEDNLVGMAINKGYNFGTVPACGSCTNDLALFSQWSRFMAVIPFYVPAEFLTGITPDDLATPLLWDINANQYVYNNNFGLNLDLTSGCDLTDFLCREKRLFTDAIVKQVAVDVCNELAYSTRNNVIAKETRDLAIYALSNPDKNNQGLITKLDQAIEALSFDFSDLSDVCLPCNDGHLIAHGAF
jgi:hypothetical protein